MLHPCNKIKSDGKCCSLHNLGCYVGGTMEAKTVAIRVQMPDTLRAKFKAQCALQSKTMNEVVIELIEGWLSENSNATL